jgi:hypothetical protein
MFRQMARFDPIFCAKSGQKLPDHRLIVGKRPWNDEAPLRAKPEENQFGVGDDVVHAGPPHAVLAILRDLRDGRRA